MHDTSNSAWRAIFRHYDYLYIANLYTYSTNSYKYVLNVITL